MGSLLYGNPGTEISFDDRALMHLQVVITAKLRRRESFLFTWTNSADAGSGRSSIWLEPVPFFIDSPEVAPPRLIGTGFRR